MVGESEIIYGVFKYEIKNRFLCSVEINGEEVVCYVPSSCRLSNFLNMTDRKVMLKSVKNPDARTSYALYAVKYGKSFVPINLSDSNRVVEQQIYRRYFSFLGKRRQVEREKKISSYRCDLYVRDTNTIIEIKSFLSFSGTAIFPSVYSERAIKQLKQISRLLSEGYRVCFILISLCTKVKKVSINSEIEDFYSLFLECVSKGMTYSALSIRLTESKIEINSKVEMNI